MDPAYPMRTQRLLLRPLRPDDVDVIVDYRNDPEVAELQDWDLPVPRERVVQHVEAQSGWTDIVPGEPRQIGIDLDGELIGDLYVGLDEHGGVAEIGFTLRTEYQGKGYAFEAASVVVADLVERLGCHRIYAQLSTKNVRSARLLERLGMHVESLAPKSYWWRGAWDDNLVCAMTAEEWRANRAESAAPREGKAADAGQDGVKDEATWFSYEYCTDVAATKEFYGDFLGLTQIWDEPDDVAFRHGCVQLAFTLGTPQPLPEGWAFQPGWSHGQLPEAPPVEKVRSISIALEPEAFQRAVGRLQASNVDRLRQEPFWVGYWAFVVKGPDGLTVELSDPVSAAPGMG